MDHLGIVVLIVGTPITQIMVRGKHYLGLVLPENDVTCRPRCSHILLLPKPLPSDVHAELRCRTMQRIWLQAEQLQPICFVFNCTRLSTQSCLPRQDSVERS